MEKESSAAATVLISFKVFIVLPADYMWSLPSELKLFKFYLSCISLTMLSCWSIHKLALAFVAGTRWAILTSLVRNLKLTNRNLTCGRKTKVHPSTCFESVIWSCKIFVYVSIWEQWQEIETGFLKVFSFLNFETDTIPWKVRDINEQ